jgi:ATP-binding protein involved in chromosome partitioning
MSLGFLPDAGKGVLLRGPMVAKWVATFLTQINWGQLDQLVIDLPPGTGDAQLTLCQTAPLTGAVIVTTPQDVSLIDAVKALNMFRQLKTPVLGVVENMSYFVCPKCGERSDIFGHGGAQHEAERQGVRFLGAVPLHMEIRETSDSGRPVVATDPEGPHAKAFREIASRVREALGAGADSRPAPKIVIEA